MKECRQCRACLEDIVNECPYDGTGLEMTLEGPKVVDGKYRVDRSLGKGGMGVVYRVRHLGLQKDFALKLIRPTEAAKGSFAELFKVEAKVLGKLKHPNIVEVTDYGVDGRAGGLPYLVMEYLEGGTLRDVCRAAGALPVVHALPLLESIAQAIDYAHDHGVLHRDLKPDNIFLSSNPGGTQAVKVLDFGLARLLERPAAASDLDTSGAEHEAADSRPHPETLDSWPEDELEPVGEVSLSEPTHSLLSESARPHEQVTVAGTPPYMAPEVIQGRARATPAADIYAFGVLAYELLAGRLPFVGRPLEVFRAHLESVPPAPSMLQPSLPPELDQALLAALEKEPERRPRRAADVVARIRTVWQQAERRRWRAHEVPRRAGLALMVAAPIALAAGFLGGRGPLRELEQRTVDARLARLPIRAPDPNLVVVSVDEATLAADPRPLADQAEEFGLELERVLDAGARGVAIDLLLPERWNRSPAFSRLVLKHAERLTLAVFSSPSGETVGTKCLAALTAAALGPQRLSELFGFVGLEEDPDGVTRRARLYYLDEEGVVRRSWAAGAARALVDLQKRWDPAASPPERFWVDHSVDWRRLVSISWKDVPNRLDRDPSLFQGRLVLLGGDFVGSGDDFHRIPRREGYPAAVSGIVLQALIVNTILSGLPIREAGTRPRFFGVALASAALFAGLLCMPKLSRVAALFAGSSLLYLLGTFLVFRTNRILLPIATPLLAALVTSSIALLLRWRLFAVPAYMKEA